MHRAVTVHDASFELKPLVEDVAAVVEDTSIRAICAKRRPEVAEKCGKPFADADGEIYGVLSLKLHAACAPLVFAADSQMRDL